MSAFTARRLSKPIHRKRKKEGKTGVSKKGKK